MPQHVPSQHPRGGRAAAAARLRLILLACACALPVVAGGCVFGGGKKKAPTPKPTGTPVLAGAAPTLPSGTGTPIPIGTATATFIVVPRTPAPQALRTASPAPAISPTPGIREENGLQIQDVSFTGRVAAAGGLRIRSAPSPDTGNVVGSVAEGAIVNVEGKVLNGAEAEQGKGRVWYIVGNNQYIYGAEGYIVLVQGAGTPAAR